MPSITNTDIASIETSKNRAFDAADSARNAAVRTPDNSKAWKAQRLAYMAASKVAGRADAIMLALTDGASVMDTRYVISEIRAIQSLSRQATRNAALAWALAADCEEHEARVTSARRVWSINKN